MGEKMLADLGHKYEYKVGWTHFFKIQTLEICTVPVR